MSGTRLFDPAVIAAALDIAARHGLLAAAQWAAADLGVTIEVRNTGHRKGTKRCFIRVVA